VEASRAVYAVDAKSAPRQGALRQGTIALRMGYDKVIHYFGYDDLEENYEFYNLRRDPGERVNLYENESSLPSRLKHQLLEQRRGVGMGRSMDESWSEGSIDHA
jgi:hypothetical protein